jgi:4-carboxymuconolactone decarboxylase
MRLTPAGQGPPFFLPLSPRIAAWQTAPFAHSGEDAMAKRSKSYAAGMKMRRRWMGKDYVAKAFRDADAFSIDLQHFVTEHGWGASWGRGGLPLKTRSIMSLSMIFALNRPHELEIHLRAALRNGITPAETRNCCCTARCTAARRPRSTASAWRARCSPSAPRASWSTLLPRRCRRRRGDFCGRRSASRPCTCITKSELTLPRRFGRIVGRRGFGPMHRGVPAWTNRKE